jgi:dihydrofolate reductase
MLISLLVAMDEEGGIGRDNRLPWRLSTDLRRFKWLTMGHHMLMGRKTYESIGRALPGRTTIVVTRQADYHAEGCAVAHSLEEGMRLAEEAGEEELFVIGGGEVFRQTLPLAGRIYLTVVHTRGGCDVFFPEYEAEVWTTTQVEQVGADDANEYATTFMVMERGEGG